MSNEVLQQAAVFYKQGDKESAAKLLVQLVKDEPNNADAWYGLAMCLDQTERKRYCLQKALAINPESHRAKQALEKLSQGTQVAASSAPALTHQENTSVSRIRESSTPTKGFTRWEAYFLAGFVFMTIFAIVVVALLVGNSNPFTTQALVVETSTPEPTKVPSTSTALPTATNSVEKEYITQLASFSQDLDSWQNDLDAWGELMARKLPDSDNDYATLLAAHSMMVESGMHPDNSILVADVLPLVQSIKQKGFTILTKLSAMTPPPEIKLPHNQFTACVEHKTNLMVQFEDVISKQKAIEIPEGPDPCRFMSESLDKIAEFIRANK